MLSGGLSSGQGTVPPNPKIVGEPVIVEPGKQGGTLRITAGFPPSLNPYVLDGGLEMFHAGLVERNLITYQMEPALAESFEWAPDGKSITFTLRNIKFSDGILFTADDVLFTFNDVVLNNEIQSDTLQELRGRLLSPGQMIIKNAEKLDARKVRFNLNLPFGHLLAFLEDFAILPKHKLADKVKKLNPSAAPDAFVKAWGPDYKPEDFAFLGPYKFKTLTTSQSTLERNSHYWKVDKNKTQLPYFNTIEIIISRDRRGGNEELNLVKAGQIDFSTRFVDFVNFKAKDIQEFLDAAQKGGLKIAYQGAGIQNTLLSLNQDVNDEALRTVFRDVRFRRAIAHLIDRERLVKEALSNFGVARETFITPFSALYDKQATALYEFNLERTKALLEEMGLKDSNKDGVRELSNGKPLQIELLINQANEARVNSAKILTTLFAGAGIKLTTLALPGAEVSKRIAPDSLNYQALLISMVGTAASPIEYFTLFHSTGGDHFYKFSDGKNKDVADYQKLVDDLLIQLTHETDATKQKSLASEFQKIVSENLPVIWLFSPGMYAAIRQNFGNVGAFVTQDALNSVGTVFSILWSKN
jgi:peptide/nickel transport system substrate-binding protein